MGKSNNYVTGYHEGKGYLYVLNLAGKLLGKVVALNKSTVEHWAHPVIYRGVLYVRQGGESDCFATLVRTTFIYWVKTSFLTLFIKQNNLSSYKDYPPQLTLLPYFIKFYLNKVIRFSSCALHIELDTIITTQIRRIVNIKLT